MSLVNWRQRFPKPVDVMTLSQQLRRHHSSEEAIWIGQQVKFYWDAVRLEAFREPLCLHYEGQALQMASRWPLAARRAQALRQRFGAGELLEIGAGIGGDSCELAAHFELDCYELDPERLACLRHNLGGAARCQAQGGLEALPKARCFYADPARRDERGRNQSQSWQPDPQLLWASGRPGCVKLAPGYDFEQIPAGADVDYLSHQGVCKESCIWTPGSGFVQALMFQGGVWLQAPRVSAPELGPLDVGMWVHELDPAAIRAQAWPVGLGWRIDETLSLLASPPGSTSPWVQSFECLEIAEADRQSLVKLQKRWDFQPLEIKKRGFDVEPEELRRHLPKGRRGGPGVLWLTRVAGRHRALVCRRATLGKLPGRDGAALSL
jgi:hypothetical protein